VAEKSQPEKEVRKERKERRAKAPRFLRAIGSYFAGSWRELRQTTWPNRRSSWSLTMAVITFTIVLMVFIVAVDYLFDFIFKELVL